MCVAVCVSVCVAACVAVCVTECVAARVAKYVAVCVEVCDGVCAAECLCLCLCACVSVCVRVSGRERKSERKREKFLQGCMIFVCICTSSRKGSFRDMGPASERLIWEPRTQEQLCTRSPTPPSPCRRPSWQHPRFCIEKDFNFCKRAVYYSKRALHCHKYLDLAFQAALWVITYL